MVASRELDARWRGSRRRLGLLVLGILLLGGWLIGGVTVGRGQAEAAFSKFPRLTKYKYLKFPHTTHTGVSFPDGKDLDCTWCHKTDATTALGVPKNWTDDAKLNPTVFKTMGNFQTYPNGHASCDTCHTKDYDPKMSKCAGCHVAGAGGGPSAALAKKPGVLQNLRYVTLFERWKRFTSPKFQHSLDPHQRGKRFDGDEAPASEATTQRCATCHTKSLTSDKKDDLRYVNIQACWACHANGNSEANAAIEESVNRFNQNSSEGLSCSYCHFKDIAKRIPTSHLPANAPTPPTP